MSERPSFAAIVLAAGQGTRMKSDRPKVLHEIAGRPMVAFPIDAALRAGANRVVVVVGHGRAEVQRALEERFGDRVVIAVQEEQRGTGHAAQCGLPALADFEGDVVILYGDVPLIETEAIGSLIDARHGTDGLALLTSVADDPSGYGRILRDPTGAVIGIREHKDASPEERAITEINPGIYAASITLLRRALAQLRTDNAQGELYLTDVVSYAARAGGVRDVRWPIESLNGVNDRAQLAASASILRRRIAAEWARRGATIRDLERVDIDADVEIGIDAVIEPNVVLRGRTVIGAGARIDVGCVLTNVEVAPHATIKPYSVAEQSRIGEAAQVGPFSHLRAGSDLGPEAHVGNFVETKKTTIGRGSKANHLAYLGDGIIEDGVNVGAGTIFCNYDGFQKHTTVLEEGSFIGSDSQLIAPVRIGRGAYVATGTTVTRDVPADALAVGRTKQQNKEGYASRLRAKLKASADAKKKGG